ncbi:MAG: D-alanine--D-alanine ligase [Bacteroidota bacterium]
MTIGLVYDRFGDTPPPPGAPPDWDAEYEPEETVAALEAAVRALGHTPVRIGSARALLDRMPALLDGTLHLDAAITIAESYGSRNREAHAPVLLELAGVPCLGSDALALSVSLDKALTKTLARAAGVATPDWLVVRHPSDLPDEEAAFDLAFPVFVKPRYEGTAKGIAPSSRCDDLDALRAEVERQQALYGQDVLVEQFVEGAEFTVAVVGSDPPEGTGWEALPVLQRAVERTTGIGLHALERYEDAAAPFAYDLPGGLNADLEALLHANTLAVVRALDARDFARADFRVDAEGGVWFLEVNTLPTFAPDGTFAIIAALMGRSYEAFLADVLARGLRRLGLERLATGD